MQILFHSHYHDQEWQEDTLVRYTSHKICIKIVDNARYVNELLVHHALNLDTNADNTCR